MTNIDEMVAPTAAETRVARAFSKQMTSLGKRRRVKVLLTEADGESSPIELPAVAVKLLSRILHETAAGNAVNVIAVHQELTIEEAAALLGVSRPYLIEQLDAKKLPFSKRGTQRRMRLQDVVAYKRRSDARRGKALDRLAAQAQKLKMGY